MADGRCVVSRWRNKSSDGPFAAFVELYRTERETEPPGCFHCGTEGVPLTNYSRTYGGNVGAHWLCRFCEVTQSASRQGAGGSPDQTVADVAAMLHRFLSDTTTYKEEPNG